MKNNSEPDSVSELTNGILIVWGVAFGAMCAVVAALSVLEWLGLIL